MIEYVEVEEWIESSETSAESREDERRQRPLPTSKLY